jgi:hypothetical protein
MARRPSAGLASSGCARLPAHGSCRRRCRGCGWSPGRRLHGLGHAAVGLELLLLAGQPSRLRNRNSVRNRPMPAASDRDLHLGDVAGQLDVGGQLDSSPSRVAARDFFRRLSLAAPAPARSCAAGTPPARGHPGRRSARRACRRSISMSSSRIRWRAWCRPTTAGIARLLATMAVCEVAPPRSVTKPPIFSCLNWMVSAGDRSWATTMRCSPLPCLRRVAGMAHQHLEHPLDHLHHVGLALAQVFVLDLLELLDQLLHLLHQGPLGVAAPRADQLARGLGQHRVGQQHHGAHR